MRLYYTVVLQGLGSDGSSFLRQNALRATVALPQADESKWSKNIEPSGTVNVVSYVEFASRGLRKCGW